MVDTDSLSLTERLVLLSIADAEREGETPVGSITLKNRTVDMLEVTETAVIGQLSEREIMRALNALGAEPYVEEHRPPTSASGKGRPEYALGADPETVFEALADDGEIGDAAEQLS